MIFAKGLFGIFDSLTPRRRPAAQIPTRQDFDIRYIFLSEGRKRRSLTTLSSPSIAGLDDGDARWPLIKNPKRPTCKKSILHKGSVGTEHGEQFWDKRFGEGDF